MEKDFECIKVKDGLYLANKMVAYDLQFLAINKFSYVINCASEVSNLFEAQGIKYQKFKIPHDRHQRIFQEEYKRLRKIKKFILEAQEAGMCCLVHCAAGRYRSLVLLIAFLMDRFQWRLRKVVDYLQSKSIPITLSESHIEELVGLERHLALKNVLTLGWEGPYADQEEELISKTYINTSNVANHAPTKKQLNFKKQLIQEEIPREGRRVQWQDRIDKQQKKQRKRLAVQTKKEEERVQNQRSRERLQNARKQAKSHNMALPKGEGRGKLGLDPEIRKQMEQAQIMNLIKSTGKLKKQLGEGSKAKIEARQCETEEDMESEKKQRVRQVDQDGKVYKLTINNYINPNINIIKKDNKKKGKAGPKKGKATDKFNRTNSEKEAFKKPTLLEKEKPRQVNLMQGANKDKRHAGVTPLRQRKQRKSEKDRELQL